VSGQANAGAGLDLVWVVEASPGPGLTEHLAIAQTEVSLRIVPCSHHEIPAGKGRR